MNDRRSRRTSLLVELALSVAAGGILVGGTQLLTLVVLPVSVERVPVWLFAAAVVTATPLAFVVGRHTGRGPTQAFIVISAFTRTRWLADLLDALARCLDQHNIDLVVKLPQHDHTGRSQLACLAKLRRKRRSYVGGFVVSVQPEGMRELAEQCGAIGQPVIFVDVRPFRDAGAYPAQTAFVGCAADEIGKQAADWIVKQLFGRGLERPGVLVVYGDAQAGRHEAFQARIRELLPSARLDLLSHGQFSRQQAREVVDSYLQHRVRSGERLDAIFCTNDEMALGAVDAVQRRAATRAGQDDPLVVGVDGIGEALATINAGTTPFRATVLQDTRRMAEVAVDTLLRMCAGERVATETFVPTTVYPMP